MNWLMFPVDKLSRKIRFVAPLAFLLSFAGCSPDIGVIDLKSGKMVHPPHGDARNIVASIDSKAGTFTTLVLEEPDLVMRTYDKSGNSISQRHIPRFAHTYSNPSLYALSGDLRLLAYVSDEPVSLNLLDVRSGTSTVLVEKFADSQSEIPLLVWLNDSTLLAVFRQYHGSTRTVSEIATFDVGTRVKTVLYNPEAPGEDYALTPDRTLLAFQDGKGLNDIDGFIKILDLQKGKLIAQLGSGDELISLPAWSRDGSELAYVEDKNLNIWNRGKNEARTLVTFPANSVCYQVVMGEGVVGYHAGWYSGVGEVLEGIMTLWPGGALKILDLNTGRKLRTVHAQFNGRVLSVDGQTAVCELGY